jgi:hypothetical protein
VMTLPLTRLLPEHAIVYILALHVRAYLFVCALSPPLT